MEREGCTHVDFHGCCGACQRRRKREQYAASERMFVLAAAQAFASGDAGRAERLLAARDARVVARRRYDDAA